jgi:hypothetical protein
MKPKGRIMQISTTNWQDLIVLTVLCEDGFSLEQDKW